MDPRDYAVLALDARRLPGLPRQAFKRRSAVAPDDSRDRALAEQIVLGVVKNCLHLAWLVSHYAQRPAQEIDARARLILMVALYQLRFLERVPDHAIVTEAVAQTRRLGEPGLARAAGFVNAVLRQAIRKPDVSGKLPPRSDAPAYAEIVLSHPRALYAKLEALLGAPDALKFCEHDNRTPPTLLRLSRGRTISDLLAAMGAEPANDAPDGAERASRLQITPHDQEGIVVVRGARQADFARWSDAGVGQVQDATSAAVAARLDVRQGMSVLDRCCGMGTKTQQLSDMTGGDGSVWAVDASGARISALRSLIARRPDLSNIRAKRAAWMGQLPQDWPAQYDRILIDAPCSNTGVLARRAEARYLEIEKTASLLPQTQLEILRDTWPFLAPGGLLVYSTCSVLPEENSAVIERFRADQPQAELLDERLTLPSFESAEPQHYHDGGYYALLRRRAQ
jgi:16S rRNA (cytosine967-C5)-methyltransferase